MAWLIRTELAPAGAARSCRSRPTTRSSRSTARRWSSWSSRRSGSGFANYFVPLQIGAPDMAFPRMNALSVWLFLGGGLTITCRSCRARRGRGRLDRLRAAVQGQYSPGPGTTCGSWAILAVSTSSILTAVNLMATVFMLRAPGHDDVADAAVHLEHADHVAAHPGGVPAAHRRAGDAVHRPALRRALLRPDARRLGDPVPAPVLVLRPSRGLRHGAAVLRRRHRHPPGVLAQADLRLRRVRAGVHGDRRPVDGGVGAPHVHHRASSTTRSSRSCRS